MECFGRTGRQRRESPQHRHAGHGHRVFIDLTSPGPHSALQRIDLTVDEGVRDGSSRPEIAGDVGKDTGVLTANQSSEEQQELSGFYCAACNGPIGPRPVVRICGCLYCWACTANATRRWNRRDFACNIRQHWRQGNHDGRETFGLGEDCSICYVTLSQRRTVCLPCGHVFHQPCIEEHDATANGCPTCRRPHGKDTAWTVGTVNVQSGCRGMAEKGRPVWWLRAPAHSKLICDGTILASVPDVDTGGWNTPTRRRLSGNDYIKPSCHPDSGPEARDTQTQTTRRSNYCHSSTFRDLTMEVEALVVQVRCFGFGCHKGTELMSTDDIAYDGYVMIGAGLFYCTGCAEETGFLEEILRVN